MSSDERTRGFTLGHERSQARRSIMRRRSCLCRKFSAVAAAALAAWFEADTPVSASAQRTEGLQQSNRAMARVGCTRFAESVLCAGGLRCCSWARVPQPIKVPPLSADRTQGGSGVRLRGRQAPRFLKAPVKSSTFRKRSQEGFDGKSPLYVLELYPYTLQP